MSAFRVGVVQMASGANRSTNLGRARALIEEAAATGAQLIVLPEVFAWRGPRADETSAIEPIPGPTTHAMIDAARATATWICAGSFLEHIPGDIRAYNTSCLISPAGDIVATYRKMHLFDIDLPGRVSVRESDGRRAGETPVVVETPLATIGMSICYDLRFPELYRLLVHRGAQIIVVPSAFTAPTGAAHWEVLLRARAIENQCWVLAANQTGTSPHGFADHGHSMIVDPWGTIQAVAGTDEGLVTAEVDLSALARIRRELPCLDHVRLGR